MDASRDIIESAKPPKPPKPGAPDERGDDERGTSPLVWTIAASAVAAAVFTGITAWETHQERVNTEVIYCSFLSGPEPGDGTRTLSEAEQRMSDQLGC